MPKQSKNKIVMLLKIPGNQLIIKATGAVIRDILRNITFYKEIKEMVQ